MLTWTPDNWASYYTCSICGVSTQVLVPLLDDSGQQQFHDDGTPFCVNDEPASSAEMDEHMEEDHPSE